MGLTGPDAMRRTMNSFFADRRFIRPRVGTPFPFQHRVERFANALLQLQDVAGFEARLSADSNKRWEDFHGELVIASILRRQGLLHSLVVPSTRSGERGYLRSLPSLCRTTG